MDITDVFINTTLYDMVSVPASTLTPDFYIHVKHELTKKVKNKCIDCGYICDIYDHTIESAEKKPETLDDSIIVYLKYNARICNPQPGTRMVCKVMNIMQGVIMAVNGPIRIIVRLQNSNQRLFKITNTDALQYVSTGKNIAPGDYMQILVNSTKNIYGNTTYGIIGHIEDIVDENVAKKYMFKELFQENVFDESDDEIADMNDDDYFEDNQNKKTMDSELSTSADDQQGGDAVIPKHNKYIQDL